MNINTEFFIHSSDPSGKGLEKVADIYIAKDFDMDKSVVPSQELCTLASTEEISEYLRRVLFEVIKGKSQGETRK